jgi:hypothetical protein
MRLRAERIASISHTVAHTLTEQRMVRSRPSSPDLAKQVEQIITEELMQEERLDADAREILKNYEREMEKGEVDSHRMFLMIKRQLAKERGIVL